MEEKNSPKDLTAKNKQTNKNASVAVDEKTKVKCRYLHTSALLVHNNLLDSEGRGKVNTAEFKINGICTYEDS